MTGKENLRKGRTFLKKEPVKQKHLLFFPAIERQSGNTIYPLKNGTHYFRASSLSLVAQTSDSPSRVAIKQVRYLLAIFGLGISSLFHEYTLVITQFIAIRMLRLRKPCPQEEIARERETN